MFYDRFSALCDEKGISVTKAIMEIGLSRSLGTKWKKTNATPNGKTLAKISEYFGVPVDFFTRDEKDSTMDYRQSQTEAPQELPLDGFTYAMHGYSGDLTEADKATVLKLVQQLVDANRKKDADGPKTD